MFKKMILVGLISMVPIIGTSWSNPLRRTLGRTAPLACYPDCRNWKYDSGTIYLFVCKKNSCLGSGQACDRQVLFVLP